MRVQGFEFAGLGSWGADTRVGPPPSASMCRRAHSQSPILPRPREEKSVKPTSIGLLPSGRTARSGKHLHKFFHPGQACQALLAAYAPVGVNLISVMSCATPAGFAPGSSQLSSQKFAHLPTPGTVRVTTKLQNSLPNMYVSYRPNS